MIRAANEADIPWLASRLKAHFSKVYGLKRPLFQDDTFTHDFMLKMINEHVVFVAERAAELIGFICGSVGPHPFEPSLKVLISNFYWVDVAFRAQTKAAAHLINVFTAWGHNNCDYVFMGLPPQTNINDRSMHKRGYRLAERFFILERA